MLSVFLRDHQSLSLNDEKDRSAASSFDLRFATDDAPVPRSSRERKGLDFSTASLLTLTS